MSSLINKYPDFELLEIETELLFQFKKYQPLKPLKKGDSIPELAFSNDFNAWQQFLNGAESNNYLSIKQLLSKPLVIGFYSHEWKEQGLEFIKQLSDINSGIRANGGNLVVITDSRTPELEKAAWNNNLTLNFYFDAGYKLAEQLGVYHKNSPVWERFSGIDAHVPLLAGFVLTPYRNITFDYTNWNIEKQFNSIELLEEVYQAGLYLNTRKSA
jgi:peroxiredoxin